MVLFYFMLYWTAESYNWLLFQVEMILEQMRLCLLKKDFVRTQIISKKISTKFFDSEEVDNLKLKFYK